MSEPAPGFIQHPTHKFFISSPDQHFTVSCKNTLLGSSHTAIYIDEATYPRRFYLPQSDLKMSNLKPTTHSTYCPFKGFAHYWDVHVENTVFKNSAWAYKNPYTECITITNHIAFYGDGFKFNHYLN